MDRFADRPEQQQHEPGQYEFFNANYRYTDTLGRELNVDADYGFFNSKTPADSAQRNVGCRPAESPAEKSVPDQYAFRN